MRKKARPAPKSNVQEIRQVGICLLTFALVTGVRAGEEPAPDPPEPPVRLKKKDSPQPGRPADAKPSKDEDRTEPPAPAPDEKETLDRIAKNMRSSEERLAGKDAGEGTRQIQRDILKDLDSLIEQSQRQPQQPSQQQPQNQQQSEDRSSRSRSRDQQMQGKSHPARSRPSSPNSQPKEAGPGKRSQAEVNKIADLYKNVWGHLPETLRQEMDAYAREEFMAKYGDLLKQYYATIAEKGRRKGE